MTEGLDVPFFDQLGIPNVVWLDDLFDAKEAPTAIDLAERVAMAIAAGTLVAHPKLEGLTSEDSPQEWALRIRERLDDPEITDYLNEIAPQQLDAIPRARPDYSVDELEKVVSSLSSTMQRLGLDRWLAVKEELIASAGPGAFLVDRERIIDGEGTNAGDDIVRELIRRCPETAFVIVLTHSVGPDGTETLRSSLATDLEVPRARLGVVSKRPGGSTLVSGVRAAVRVTLTQLTCAVVTGRIASVMRQSLDATEQALGDLSVQALDRAVFENSLTEGASEIDVLARILASRQRTEVDANIAGALDDVHSPIARMRKLRLLESLPESLPQLRPEDASLLRQWRRDEVFDADARLNALRAPLACGDVFQKDGTGNYFILLGQPCDLVVRANGQRNAQEAVLVKVRVPYTPAAASEGCFFEVPALDGQDRWALDFRNWVSVNLDCLEWTSFNNDGRVAFSPSAQGPHGLLPGWEQRFVKAKNRFKDKRIYCLSLGDIPGRVATASAAGVAFPYRRVARLRAPRAYAAYAAYASFHARGAFDHDFAKGLDNTTVSDTRQP